MALEVTTIATQDRVVDGVTGEVLKDEQVVHETQVTYERNPEPDFVKVYLDHIAEFVKAPKSSMRVFWLLTQYMSYAQDKQRIYLNSAMKRDIANQLNVTVDYVTKSITALVKHEILKRVDRGTYAVNPKYVGRGKWTDIKQLRAEFDYMTGTVTTIRD
jgi:hypothetical protein